jgi:hypothetical protein
MKNWLPVSYGILLLGLAATLGGYIYGTVSHTDWVAEPSLNLGANIVGILLTVLLIDTVIRRNENTERRRIRRITFQQLRRPLLRHLQVLYGMYKASVLQAPDVRSADIPGLFDARYFAELAFLDFPKPAPVSSPIPLQWFDYLSMAASEFKADLGRTIDRYALFLDSESVELTETLINSVFISLLQQVPAIRDAGHRGQAVPIANIWAGEGMSEIVREYVVSYTPLVEHYNRTVNDEERLTPNDDLWRNDVAPSFGSAREAGWRAPSAG